MMILQEKKIQITKQITIPKINYQIELDKIIREIEQTEKIPTLLLHSCCGPCSSYVLEYLSKYFEITVFYYNPNIYPSQEYWYRVEEQKKIIELTDAKNPIRMIEGKYEAAKLASSNHFDYFTTTLTISPHKNSQVLNRIAQKVGQEYGVTPLPSDFKKKGGFKRSCEITERYGMYRQDYCGCEFSMERLKKKESEESKKTDE